MKSLPNKLSALLRIAVADARKVQAASRRGYRGKDRHKYVGPDGKPLYRCDRTTMGSWHEPPGRVVYGISAHEVKKACEICLAGAVMTVEFDVPPTASIAPSHFKGEAQNDRKFWAINSMRQGDFRGAWATLRPDAFLPKKTQAMLVAAEDAYGRPKTLAPWATYLKCARILEKGGL